MGLHCSFWLHKCMDKFYIDEKLDQSIEDYISSSGSFASIAIPASILDFCWRDPHDHLSCVVCCKFRHLLWLGFGADL